MFYKDSTIALLTCGGTIDKIYFDAESSYSVGDAAIDMILKRARAHCLPSTSLMKKDSLDMDVTDRAAVVTAVRHCLANRILITHGTDTMADSARAIAADVADKTVVLTGAFLPAAFRDSDADFNIGFALGALRVLPAGVYVAMNGRLLPASTVRKNRCKGQFEAD